MSALLFEENGQHFTLLKLKMQLFSTDFHLNQIMNFWVKNLQNMQLINLVPNCVYLSYVKVSTSFSIHAVYTNIE